MCIGKESIEILTRIFSLSGTGAEITNESLFSDTSSELSLQILDRQLQSILEDVRLVYLLERQGGWDASANWEDMLSLGEQQRLGMVCFIGYNMLEIKQALEEVRSTMCSFECSVMFTYRCCKFLTLRIVDEQARLFFHHPKFGILDECTK